MAIINRSFSICPYDYEMDELYKAVRIFEKKYNINKSAQAVCYDMLMKYARQLIEEDENAE